MTMLDIENRAVDTPQRLQTVEPPAIPTLWGLTPSQLHDRFWAARGVQVVRCCERTQLAEDAELYLLMAPQLLALFRLRPLIDRLSWIRPQVMWVRLSDDSNSGYREKVITRSDGALVRIERCYGGSDARLARVALTSSKAIARMWQSAANPQEAWQILRGRVSRLDRTSASLQGRACDRTDPDEIARFMHELVEVWHRPDATVDRAHQHAADVWIDPESTASESTRFIGPTWIGAGRNLSESDVVIGSAVLWDDPKSRPKAGDVPWDRLEPTGPIAHPHRAEMVGRSEWFGKRAFDVAFAFFALALVLPIFPLVMLAIYLEDGRPFFFAHWRETRGGRQFPCLKFRSMRKDADEIKKRLCKENQADGPQFFIENDPRVTRVGRILRKTHIDELPQFFNVLTGDMSIVGPRPSPFKENQYCPAWREARLSVRPGVTGLWQVMRTREEGLDFQEWIRWDMQYVNRQSLPLDLWIIFQTVRHIILRK